MSRTGATTAFDRLSDAVRGRPPLQPLDPVEYAVGHALFEARSDQRGNLTRWLVQHLTGRDRPVTRLLSIGCGDGVVDVQVADALVAHGHPVDYVGIEPYGPRGRLFSDRMSAIEGVRTTVLTSSFADARPQGRYDAVLAVHSLYYVADLAATVRRACSLLAPGGELVILHAPRDPLNTLVPLLCPGRGQPFTEEVTQLLLSTGLSPRIDRLDSRLDLTETGVADTDRRLLDFTVQAQVPAALAPLVRDALGELALAGPGLVLPHPVDAIVVGAAQRF